MNTPTLSRRGFLQASAAIILTPGLLMPVREVVELDMQAYIDLLVEALYREQKAALIKAAADMFDSGRSRVLVGFDSARGRMITTHLDNGGATRFGPYHAGGSGSETT